MKISLVLATIGRFTELRVFIENLLKSKESLMNSLSVELIIVDQNPQEFGIEDLVNVYRHSLDIIYIRSSIVGLSTNRNLGLAVATGDLVGFPDDDCTYYENTLTSVFEEFVSKPEVKFVIGRIFDRKTGENIIKSWPIRRMNINRFNYYALSSSITLFVRASYCLRFNENLGAGRKFGSCEDPDLIYRLLRGNAIGVYTPNIETWHPVPDFSTLSLSKVRSYAAGFGYFSTYDLRISKLILLFLLVLKKVSQLLFIKNRFVRGYFAAYFVGLLTGVIAEKERNIK